MASYDPKRPRPSAGETEEPAPVEALLSPGPETPEPASADDAAVEVDLRVVASNGSAPKAARDVPVAPAPEQGTANRAILAAAAGSAVVLALVVVVLWRRRRRSA